MKKRLKKRRGPTKGRHLIRKGEVLFTAEDGRCVVAARDFYEDPFIPAGWEAFVSMIAKDIAR